MLTKSNVKIGLETRFGPDWPGVRCGAKTKAGGKCQRPAVKRTGRCTRHACIVLLEGCQLFLILQ